MRRALTSTECKLWSTLKGEKLQGLHFRSQQPVLGFIADFYCHKAGLIVEVDGAIHQQAEAYDIERDQALVDHGFLILRFTNRAVRFDLERVLFKISQVAYKRASAYKTH